MSGRRDDSLIMDDIVGAAARLIELGSSLSTDPDRDTAEMALWNLTVLGEGAKRLRPATREQFGDVDWGAMARTRDVVVHHYEGVDWEIVGHIVNDDLTRLLSRLVEIREALRLEFDAEN